MRSSTCRSRCPTIVAGLTLLALYGPGGPFGVDVAFTRLGLLVALLFVTLPFVVRAVQPVLLELDTEMEEAAASLGAGSIRHLPPDRLPEPAARRSSPESRSPSRAPWASSVRSC